MNFRALHIDNFFFATYAHNYESYSSYQLFFNNYHLFSLLSMFTNLQGNQDLYRYKRNQSSRKLSQHTFAYLQINKNNGIKGFGILRIQVKIEGVRKLAPETSV